MAKPLFIIICSNRFYELPKETVTVIEKTRTPVIFVKQNLTPFYIHHPFITEIISATSGISLARNLGIKYALARHADMVAFTDDDCIITTSWIKTIKHSFADPHLNLVYGQTLSYHPNRHPHQFCPSTFSRLDPAPITKINHNSEQIGYGNNFAVSRKLLKTVHGFSLWLGPGTKVSGGEDADLAIRSINSGFPAYYHPTMLVYHNKWLSKTDLNKLYLQYNFGFGCVYFYHALHGVNGCFGIIVSALLADIKNFFHYLRFVFAPRRLFQLIFNSILNTLYLFKGIIVAIYYYFALL